MSGWRDEMLNNLINNSQLKTMKFLLRGEEREHFSAKMK